ncbi:MAG: cob(I)yrinic acid a,c-diamide adenosyltransferase, partial [bacterium]|nr:cob(I)yrinic acid a,c-diamide adenosyltransferase [bacterium]
MQKKHVANKGIIVNKQGQILLVRDAGKDDHKSFRGMWDFPGGRMDQGETPHEGLLRELGEELGIKSEQVEIGGIAHTGLWGVGGDKINEPIVGLFHIVTLKEEINVQLSQEHTEFRWVDPRNKIEDEHFAKVHGVISAYKKYLGTEGVVDESIKGHKGFGLIHVTTGNGKGKTTAALGTAIRALGAGKKVGIVYFDKGGDTHYSERSVLDKLDGIDYVATGRDRIDPVTGRFDFSIQDIDKQEAKRGLGEVQKMFQSNYDLIILDEINSTTDLGMLTEEEVLKLLKQKPETAELILTGRDAPQSFVDQAHLI